MRYLRNHDKSTLRSGAHRGSPCAHRNLYFVMCTFVLPPVPAPRSFAAQERREIAKNMKTKRIPTADIAEVTGLSADEIEKL